MDFYGGKMNKRNLVGQRFGRLLVLCDDAMRNSDGTIKWKCQCDCGNIIHVSTNSLTSGNTQSCGCLQKERAIASHKKENKYYESNGVIHAFTSNGVEFLVDFADWDNVKHICWCSSKDNRIIGRYNNKNVRLHRLLMNPSPTQLVDHINNNPLDNRRCNLRIVNKSQNGANRPKTKRNTSGYKGVTKLKNGKYMARIMVNYRGIYLGCYETPIEASRAYQKAEREYFGEYAYKGGDINE